MPLMDNETNDDSADCAHQMSLKNSSQQKKKAPNATSSSRSRKRTDRNHIANPEESLQQLLRSRNLYESAAQSELRSSVLTELEACLQKWASRISPPTTGARQTVHVCTFGSYRLGVHNASSDIDVLCMTPTYVTRHDFFASLVQLLEQHDDEVITDLQPVPVAFTPVIKMKWKGISVDLVFANFSDSPTTTNISSTALDMAHGKGQEGTITPSQQQDHDMESFQSERIERCEFHILDQHLIGLDEPSIRSLNGVRVAQMLLNLLPSKKLNNFRIILRTVKEWATVHGVYSNVLGFLGGVNWAIMVVKIVQLYPNASTTQLLYRFFTTFSRWRWPKPLLITPALYSPPPGVSPQVVWNPTIYPRDRTHLMPIITPVYPCMNSAYNVGPPQLRRIHDELERAAAIVGRIVNAEHVDKGRGTASWDELMEENDFFQRHAHYIQVCIESNNAKDFRLWFGLCEARLRILIASLESAENGVQAYPFARFFSRREPVLSGEKEKNLIKSTLNAEDANYALDSENREPTLRYVSSFFVALRFAPDVECIDLTSSVQEILFKVNSWEDRREGMDMTIEHLMWNQLPDFVFSKSSQGSCCNKRESKDDGEAQQQRGADDIDIAPAESPPFKVAKWYGYDN